MKPVWHCTARHRDARFLLFVGKPDMSGLHDRAGQSLPLWACLYLLLPGYMHRRPLATAAEGLSTLAQHWVPLTCNIRFAALDEHCFGPVYIALFVHTHLLHSPCLLGQAVCGTLLSQQSLTVLAAHANWTHICRTHSVFVCACAAGPASMLRATHMCAAAAHPIHSCRMH